MHCPSSIYSSIFHLSIFFFLSASLSIPFRHWDIRSMFTVEIPVLKRIFSVCTFVSFFPQLVAGPIERSSHLPQQLATPHKFNSEEAKSGLLLMLWGFFLKLYWLTVLQSSLTGFTVIITPLVDGI